MARSREQQLEVLESSYRELLLSALQRCTKGEWFLFGHQDAAISSLGRPMRTRLGRPYVSDLLELGLKIEKFRSKLGYPDAFSIHERLPRMRSSRDANTAGEPKRARQWLEELLPD
jgi:hypothetical protein